MFHIVEECFLVTQMPIVLHVIVHFETTTVLSLNSMNVFDIFQ